jgi:putative transport protein
MGIATWFAATLRQYPEIAIFLVLAIGYYFGKFTFRGIGLGSVTATLLAGVVSGQTASLGLVCDIGKSQVPALGYTVTYAVGNTLLTIWGMVVIVLLT